MKKTIILIISGYLAGLMGSATFEYILKDEMTGQQESFFAVREYPADSDAMAFANNPANPTAFGNMKEMNDAFARASRQTTPSVVYIKTYTERVYTNTWYEWFFGDRTSQSYISTGSGVIFTSDGYIVTNNHVIESADVIEVIHNKRTYEASLISTDPSTDLAVLKIEADDLPNIKVGSARNLEVGEWVIAVGNPFNLTSTVTAGIVSAKGRQINILKTNFPIESFIQTDAAINPGNSGGALVDVNGELVGINTAILSKTGTYAGYGFAVPVDIVAKIISDLINYGEVQKAYIGAELVDIDQQIGREMELNDWNGVLVRRIQEGGAADKAGIREKDIVIGIDGDRINSMGELEEIISYHSPGDRLEIALRRGNQIENKHITLTNAEGTTSILKREVYSSRSLGADFEVVPKVERELLGIPQGVRIKKIRGGLMRRLNIEEGFTITHINKVPVENPQKLADILSKIRGRVYIEGVNREGVKGYYSYFF
jgi:serine protease Do